MFEMTDDEKAIDALRASAMLAIDVNYFQQMLDKLKVGPHGSAFVIQTDGTLLARNPAPPKGVLPPTLNSPSLAPMLRVAERILRRVLSDGTASSASTRLREYEAAI